MVFGLFKSENKKKVKRYIATLEASLNLINQNLKKIKSAYWDDKGNSPPDNIQGLDGRKINPSKAIINSLGNMFTQLNTNLNGFKGNLTALQEFLGTILLSSNKEDVKRIISELEKKVDELGAHITVLQANESFEEAFAEMDVVSQNINDLFNQLQITTKNAKYI